MPNVRLAELEAHIRHESRDLSTRSAHCRVGGVRPYDARMEHEDGRHEADDEQPDDAVTEYENDQAENRESLEREAGLTAFGGPTFGHLFGQQQDDGGFDAEHNP